MSLPLFLVPRGIKSNAKAGPPPILTFGCTAVPASAQITRLQAREAEWKSYACRQTNFARQINPDKDFIFRVPADWKQQGTELIFNGPHVFKISSGRSENPDGYPLQDYFGSILQAVQRPARSGNNALTRKTQLQDLEAREIFLETPDTEGEVYRSTSWVTVNGPVAITFNLQVPVAHAAEIEPFFKAVVQSVIFVSPRLSGIRKRCELRQSRLPRLVQFMRSRASSRHSTRSTRIVKQRSLD